MEKNLGKLFWIRVHNYLTNYPHYTVNFNKLRVRQVFNDNNRKDQILDGDNKTYVKELRFSNIRLIDSKTLFIFFNYFNIIDLENTIYFGSDIIVEFPTCCMIIFTESTFHIVVDP